MATNWLIRKTGSDSNGGTSASVRSTGTDGQTVGVGAVFSSPTATWTSADVGHGIYASNTTILRLITAVRTQQTLASVTTVNSSTTLTSAGLFDATMVGCAVGGLSGSFGNPPVITAYTDASHVTLNNSPSSGAGASSCTIGAKLTTSGASNFGGAYNQTWTVGGALLTFARAMVTASGVHNAYSAGDSIYVGAGVYRETVANTLSGAVTASGTHGVTSTNGTTFTDSTANGFTSGMVGKNIEIVAGGNTFICKVTAYTSSSVVTIAPATAMGFPTTAYSSCTWQVGKVAVIGDVDGALTGDAGQVTLSAYTTSDTAAPSASALLALAATTNLSFSLITFVGGSASLVTSTAATAAANYTFTDCTVMCPLGASAIAIVSSTTGLALGVTVDRCVLLSAAANTTGVVNISSATTASGAADFDLTCVVRSCLILSGSGCGVAVVATGSAAHLPGGVRVYGCTLVGTNGVKAVTASELSTSVPCEVHNCLLINSGTGISAATAGQITGSYNVIFAGTPETNYTYGTGDVSNSAGTGTYKAPILELGQSMKWAGVIRQFLAPDGAKSPLLGAGNPTISGNYPGLDWSLRPRPSGGGSANPSVGYSELHDFSVQNTVTYPVGQTSSAQMTGPGDTDIWVPVDAVSTTIAIQLYQNAGYTGSTYATATIEAQGELGVVTQVQTCSSTTGSWQTLTFSAITPSKAGYIKIRVTSFDTSGTGVLYFGALVAT